MIAVVAMSMGFCGCSDDDENNGASESLTFEDLDGHWYLDTDNEDLQESLSFNVGGNGKVVYEYSYYPGDEEYGIIASGFYSVNQSTLTTNYSDVDVYTSIGSDSYNGFTDEQSRSVTYTIVSYSNDVLTLRDASGATLRFVR